MRFILLLDDEEDPAIPRDGFEFEQRCCHGTSITGDWHGVNESRLSN